TCSAIGAAPAPSSAPFRSSCRIRPSSACPRPWCICAARPTGWACVTAPTASGKSTTLAALIDHINTHRSAHIITIEDPIEFVHPNKKCLVNQREVGLHTEGFKTALRAALREDPDILLVGEMRDLETV